MEKRKDNEVLPNRLITESRPSDIGAHTVLVRVVEKTIQEIGTPKHVDDV
jgi:hypothetical protein